jgi:hypothetical protein
MLWFSEFSYSAPLACPIYCERVSLTQTLGERVRLTRSPFARSPMPATALNFQSIKASNPDLALRAGCLNACG